MQASAALLLGMTGSPSWPVDETGGVARLMAGKPLQLVVRIAPDLVVIEMHVGVSASEPPAIKYAILLSNCSRA